MSVLASEWLSFAVGAVAGETDLLVGRFSLLHRFGEYGVLLFSFLVAFFIGDFAIPLLAVGNDCFDFSVVLDQCLLSGRQCARVATIVDRVD